MIRAIRRGAFADAEQSLDDGLRLSRELRYPYAEAKLLYVGGLAALAPGNDAVARERLRQAQAALTTLGEGLYLPHVEQTLASLA